MNRLDVLRGPHPAVDHNARTIAALAANPGCDRRAVFDAAGVDKRAIARHLGHPAPFGQSVFAITRARAFEKLVKADGCAELLRLLRELFGLDVGEVTYVDVAETGEPGHAARHARTRELLRGAARAAADGRAAGVLVDHPLLRLDVGGTEVHLEPDVIALQAGGRFHVIAIKSFAIIDGRAEPAQVAAAARQAAVYVHALRTLLAAEGADPALVAHNVVLVCPKDFANTPTATFVDVRQQLAVLARQLARLTRIDRILDRLPPDLTFDLRPGPDGTPTRPADDLARAVRQVPARFAPECLSTCDMAYFCRAEAREQAATDLLGRAVRDALGGLATIPEVLGLAEGAREPAEDEAEIADRLRLVHRFYAEALDAAAKEVAVA
ncbi:hypothetical protein GCM10010106_34000 [Thermopolyspora flexuosa]|uniref:Secreted protein n=1 Tax=Thermopolyspora flexuosa TaxID=103836 RepID=A0A543ITC6_9ACTN|nr:hypothetical protein [Thermopolyspora flexuosa]TQM73834.1 hypothetical protein FHX40_0489 [Thermopolyspora flexuosa]GGM84427.1 hypothetical protein GCM10010106_34000 [Thermopolyspora flexuosa]